MPSSSSNAIPALCLALGCGVASRPMDSDPDAGGTDAGAGGDASADARCVPAAIAPVDQATMFRHDFAVGADGTAYSAVSSDQRVFVRVSTDRGVSWTPTPDVPYGTERGRVSVAVTDAGEIFVATVGNDTGGNRRGVLFRSTGPSAGWTMVDQFDAENVFDLLVAASGRIYISGVGDAGTATTGWFVRSGTVGGTFATSEHIPGGEPGNDSNNAIALAADRSGNVYAAGVVYDGANLTWTVRKTTNGASWSLVDRYESTPQTWAVAAGIAIGRSDSIVVAGEAGEDVDDSYYNRWLVRRGIAGGSGWQTIQRLPALPSDLGIFMGRAIAADGDGRIFVAGYRGTTNSTGDDFLVYGSSDDGATWSELTRVDFTAGTQTLVTFDRVAVGPDGTLWVSRPDAIRAGCPQ